MVYSKGVKLRLKTKNFTLCMQGGVLTTQKSKLDFHFNNIYKFTKSLGFLSFSLYLFLINSYYTSFTISNLSHIEIRQNNQIFYEMHVTWVYLFHFLRQLQHVGYEPSTYWYSVQGIDFIIIQIFIFAFLEIFFYVHLLLTMDIYIASCYIDNIL